MDFLNFKKHVIQQKKWILCYLAIGLLMVFLFKGKSTAALKAIAVSPDERHIACFEIGNGDKIRCFRSDGAPVFVYDVPSDISAGGHCALWFEDERLCVSFYRTEKIVFFSLDGTILDIARNTAEEDPPEFPSFSRNENKYVFKGDEVTVVYDEGCFLGYWFFGAERDLSITLQNGETKIVWTATSTEGITIGQGAALCSRVENGSLS